MKIMLWHCAFILKYHYISDNYIKFNYIYHTYISWFRTNIRDFGTLSQFFLALFLFCNFNAQRSIKCLKICYIFNYLISTTIKKIFKISKNKTKKISEEDTFFTSIKTITKIKNQVRKNDTYTPNVWRNCHKTPKF